MNRWLKTALVTLCVFAGWLVLAVATFDDDPKVAERINVSPAR
jgi:hypothetical protein